VFLSLGQNFSVRGKGDSALRTLSSCANVAIFGLLHFFVIHMWSLKIIKTVTAVDRDLLRYLSETPFESNFGIAFAIS